MRSYLFPWMGQHTWKVTTKDTATRQWLGTRFGLPNGFIGLLTTGNYNRFTDLHTLQITVRYDNTHKVFHVFTCRFWVTVPVMEILLLSCLCCCRLATISQQNSWPQLIHDSDELSTTNRLVSSSYSLGADRIENIVSTIYFIVVHVSVAVDVFIESLPSNSCLRQSPCHNMYRYRYTPIHACYCVSLPTIFSLRDIQNTWLHFLK
jgi:hypothetical protein